MQAYPIDASQSAHLRICCQNTSFLRNSRPLSLDSETRLNFYIQKRPGARDIISSLWENPASEIQHIHGCTYLLFGYIISACNPYHHLEYRIIQTHYQASWSETLWRGCNFLPLIYSYQSVRQEALRTSFCMMLR